MRLIASVFLALPLLVSQSVAPSPTDGRVIGNAYVNSYFHFSFAWPKIVQPFDTSSLNLGPQSPYGNEFMLFCAREGNEPYGVIMLAEKLNVPTPHSTGVRDSADFLNRLMRFRPDEHVTNVSKKHFNGTGGLVFDEVDYEQNGGFSSGIITTVGQFLIVFKCNAKSASELALINQSVAAMQIQK